MRMKLLFLLLSVALVVLLLGNDRVLSNGNEPDVDADSAQAAGLDPQQYLPIFHNLYCANYFFDDFSREASGWPVGENQFILAEYFNGEYRLVPRDPSFIFLFRAPTCDRDNYTVETDVRWDGVTGNSYGLLFDITAGFESYYLFDMNSDLQLFRVFLRTPAGFSIIVPVTPAPSLAPGTASNHIGVVRSGSSFTLFINGTTLGTWNSDYAPGAANVGVVVSRYEGGPDADARFDNFSVVEPTAVAGDRTAVMPGSGSIMRHLEAVPAALEWSTAQE